MLEDHELPLTKQQLALREIINIAEQGPTESDPYQQTLFKAIQKNRALILSSVTENFLHCAKDPKMLEAICKLLSDLEKSGRDDNKDKDRKKLMEDTKISNRELVSALQEISRAKIKVPSYATSPVINMITSNNDGLDNILGELKNEDFEFTNEELLMGTIKLDKEGQIEE